MNLHILVEGELGETVLRFLQLEIRYPVRWLLLSTFWLCVIYEIDEAFNFQVT